jgi:hypothetical protein
MTDIAIKDASSKKTITCSVLSVGVGIVLGLLIGHFGVANIGKSELTTAAYAARDGIPASVLASKAVREGKPQDELLGMLRKAASTRRFDKVCSLGGFEDPGDSYSCRDWGGYRVVRWSDKDRYFKVVSRDQVIELDLYQKNADAEDFLDVPKLIRIFDR